MTTAIIVQLVILAVSTAALVKGADFFIGASEKIGVALRLSPFVIGVLLVGVGTSLPEFASSLTAVMQGTTEIAPANAIGSNIANILLIIGILAIFVRKLTIKRDLLHSELTLFVVATSLFIGTAFDGVITVLESILLTMAFIVYVSYTISRNGEENSESEKYEKLQEWGLRKLKASTFLYFILGLAGVVLGAKFLIGSVISLAGILNISTGVLAATVVALGTSLPELFVSLAAARRGNPEVAVGNIFGSNAFNILFATGVPGLFAPLVVDQTSLAIGIPILAVASFILFVSGIAKKIYRWEGYMFLIYYLFFILKMSGIA